MSRSNAIDLVSTCPASSNVARARYLDVVAAVAQWSERAGCVGMVIPADRDSVDPWLLAQFIAQRTVALIPVVTVRPGDMPAWALARQVTSIGFLHARQVGLDLVADGVSTDRFVEHAGSVQLLTSGADGVRLTPPLSRSLAPRWFVSGDPGPACDAARRLDATVVIDAASPHASVPETPRRAVRLGIIARDRADYAWTIARSRFPCDRRSTNEAERYWSAPRREYRATAPYIVGSYDDVAEELAAYFVRGCRTVILDTPAQPDDLEHARIAVDRAVACTVAA